MECKSDCVFCNLSPDEIILERTKNFYAMMCKGPIVEGYVIIIPVRHVITMSDLGENEVREFESFKEHTRELLTKAYRSCISVEHGRCGYCVEHAHLHMIPTTVDFLDILRNDFGNFIEVWGWCDVISLAKEYEHYLFYEDQKGKEYFFPIHKNVMKRYFRRELIKALNMPMELIDHEKYPQYDLMKKGERRLKEAL